MPPLECDLIFIIIIMITWKGPDVLYKSIIYSECSKQISGWGQSFKFWGSI